MRIREVVNLSLKLMLRNRLRSALTILGIVIGIASIIIVFSAGEGIRSLITSQIESFGTNIVHTQSKIPNLKRSSEASGQGVSAMASGIQITTLKEKDLEDVKKLDNIDGGYGVILSQETLTYLNETKKVFLFGVGADYIRIDKSELISGYFFSEADNKNMSAVAVLGYKIAQDFFGEESPIGKTVVIKNKRFEIIGVLGEKGSAGSIDFDSMVILPVKTLQKKIMGIDHFMYMIHNLKDVDLSEETALAIEDILRENHHISDPDQDDFRVSTMKEMLKTSEEVTNTLTIFLLLIVAVSLVVGGVGILNVMYVIVSERTPEIGLRKALGANFYDIMQQFLIESVLITLIGSFIGIIVGIFVSCLIYWGANRSGLDWQLIIPLKAFVVAIIFALFFGIIFGLFPARKAGRLDPVEALRKE